MVNKRISNLDNFNRAFIILITKFLKEGFVFKKWLMKKLLKI